jgi:hypothetical protein
MVRQRKSDDRLHIRLPGDLKQRILEFAQRKNTTVTELIVRFLTRLLEEEAKKENPVDAEQI